MYPAITIIIPVYNVAPFVTACLRSVMSQTYCGPIECLIVDDCGTDNSMEIVANEVAAYQGEIDFRIIHREQNGGLSAARNSGLSAAKGEYVLFLDSDDLLPANSISELAAKLEDAGVDVVIGSFEIRDIDGKSDFVRSISSRPLLKNEAIMRAYRHGCWLCVAPNKLYSTRFLKDHNLKFTEGIYHEDELWSFQWVSVAQHVEIVSTSTYLYLKREGSITMDKSKSAMRVASWLKIIKAMTSLEFEEPALRTNRDAYNIVEDKVYNALYLANQSLSHKELLQSYHQLRLVRKMSTVRRLNLMGFCLRAWVRDMHYLLFPQLADLYVRCMFKVRSLIK